MKNIKLTFSNGENLHINNMTDEELMNLKSGIDKEGWKQVTLCTPYSFINLNHVMQICWEDHEVEQLCVSPSDLCSYAALPEK